ncbi:hypothetical protein [Bosea sp. 124]|uniref:hypothetical protein n=1 Tax=Bosea sp. 124 TaxID=2135642 RepID=UPI0011B24D49|nr:hypothetical protein [Bosea sp. 124]
MTDLDWRSAILCASGKHSMAARAMCDFASPRCDGCHQPIAFRAWTDDGRLRHASFKGVRDDSDVGEIYEIE